MENRRQTYRHPFVQTEKAGVEMTGLAEKNTIRGELVDLSIDGMKVRLEAHTALDVGAQLTIREIRRPTPPVHLPLGLVSQVKYVVQEGLHVCLGMQFLRQASPEVSSLHESRLRRFLVEEQRRMLRLRLAGQGE